MYSLSSRCIRNGIQASPLSIQTVLRRGKRSGMPFTTQLVRWSMLCQAKPSACTAMKRLVIDSPESAQLKAAWKASGRLRSCNAA